MTKKKISGHKASKIAKYLPWIFMVSIMFPSNYMGHSMIKRNASGYFSSDHTATARTRQARTIEALLHPSKATYSNQKFIGKPFLLVSFLTFVTSTCFTSLMLGYLNSLSLVKQCVLLYLYKDIGIVFIAMTGSGFAAISICYWNGSEHGMDESQSMLISFSIIYLTQLSLLLMNIVAILKLYMAKKMIVDPPMPWGDNENLGVNIIRIVSGSLVLGLVVTLYTLGMYPKFYYLFSQHHKSLIDLPQETMVFESILLLLIITFIIFSCVTKYYESLHRQNLDTGVPRQINSLLWIFVITLVIMMLVAGFKAFGLKTRVQIYHIFTPLVNIIASILVILKTDTLKSYVTKTLKNKIYEMKHLNVQFVLMCLGIYVFICLCIN